jgi:YD repeat-containing protein
VVSLGYDRGGNVISKDQHVQGAPPAEQGEWTYRYDPAGRMVGATDPQGVETLYAYDGAGNRTGTKEGEDPAVLTSHDARGLPTETTGGTTYTHDPAGGLTGITGPEGDWSFSYDAWGRLRLAVPGSGEVVSYALDALGRTASRTEGAEVTTFAYAGEGREPARVVASSPAAEVALTSSSRSPPPATTSSSSSSQP